MVEHLISEYNLSQRAACRAMAISRTSFNYQPDLCRDEPVVNALLQLAEKKPTYGFGLMFATLRRQGKTWNHKRVYRIYKLLKLNLRRKGKNGYQTVILNHYPHTSVSSNVGRLIL